jgi:hypothetical protein
MSIRFSAFSNIGPDDHALECLSKDYSGSAEHRTVVIFVPNDIKRDMDPEISSEADFRTLGLKPGSKPSEVRQAYRALAKKWHPDRHHSKPYETRTLAEKKFREINEAYRRISERWGKTPRPAKSRSTAGPHSARRGRADPSSAQAAARKISTLPRALWTRISSAAAQGRVKIDIGTFSKKKIIPAAFLLATAAFILWQLPSFFPDTAVDKEATAPLTSLPPPASEDSTGPQTSEATGPEPPTHLASPASPISPPALLQPTPTAPRAFFTLASTASEVLGIQGPPTRIQGQTWIYGLCEVHFRSGRVYSFNNFDGSLRVRMEPAPVEDRSAPDHISIGSSDEEVLLVQGTPTRVEGDRWFYGFAELVFKNRRVVEYDNYFGTLKMCVLPSSSSGEPPGNSFAVGSTTDEVLAVQGTPTAIHGNRWSFGLDSVFFHDGKVHSVTNSDGTLRFSDIREPRSAAGSDIR